MEWFWIATGFVAIGFVVGLSIGPQIGKSPDPPDPYGYELFARGNWYYLGWDEGGGGILSAEPLGRFTTGDAAAVLVARKKRNAEVERRAAEATVRKGAAAVEAIVDDRILVTRAIEADAALRKAKSKKQKARRKA